MQKEKVSREAGTMMVNVTKFWLCKRITSHFGDNKILENNGKGEVIKVKVLVSSARGQMLNNLRLFNLRIWKISKGNHYRNQMYNLQSKKCEK